MTIDEIHATISRKFPQLQTGPREPVGFSWFDGEPHRGPDSNRIVRAKADSDGASAELKLSVSRRLQDKKAIKPKQVVLTRFTKGELVEMVAEELRLFRKHFGGSTQS